MDQGDVQGEMIFLPDVALRFWQRSSQVALGELKIDSVFA